MPHQYHDCLYHTKLQHGSFFGHPLMILTSSSLHCSSPNTTSVQRRIGEKRRKISNVEKQVTQLYFTHANLSKHVFWPEPTVCDIYHPLLGITTENKWDSNTCRMYHHPQKPRCTHTVARALPFGIFTFYTTHAASGDTSHLSCQPPCYCCESSDNSTDDDDLRYKGAVSGK